MTEPGRMVYVVTSGEYWKYRIGGVYTTLESATAAAGAEGRVEWYALDESDNASGPWAVRMSADGDGARASRITKPEEIGEVRRFRDGELRIHVMATSKQQAIKAADEVRAASLIETGTFSAPEGGTMSGKP